MRALRLLAFAVGVAGPALLAAPARADDAIPAATTTTAPATTTTTTIPGPPLPGEPSSTPTNTLPPATGIDDAGDDSPGLFDFAGKARKAINDWFRDLATDAANAVLGFIGNAVFTTPDLTTQERIVDVWHVSWGIANSVYVLLIIVGGITAMSHETVQTRYAMKDVLPRLLLGWVALNGSLHVARLAIGWANELSRALIATGVGENAAAGLAKLIVSTLTGNVFISIVALAVVILGLGVLLTYVARVATLLVLVAGAPLFLAMHALPQTEAMARLWWRSLIGCLAIQVGQALIFVTGVRVFLEGTASGLIGIPGGSLMDLLIVGTLFYLMLKLPSFARQMIFSPKTNRVTSTAKQYVVHQGIRRGVAAVGAAL